MKPARLLLIALLVGCGETPAPRTAANAPAEGGVVRIVDDAGDTVRLAAPARRVVSLSPATTELVFALGAGDRLVGRTRWCDYPPAAREVADVGDGIPPNAEAVLARQPDLILLYLSPQNSEPAARFRAAGIPVLQLAFNHLADVPRLARLLGPVLGQPLAGDSLARAFAASLDSLRMEAASGSSGPSVLILAWDQPPIAIGAGSFQSEILTLAGARNLFQDVPAPSAPVSIEAIAARNPDLVLTGDTGEPAFSRKPEWQAIPAVRNGRFVRLGDPAFGRPSPRAPQLVRELRRRLAQAAP